MNMLQLHEIAKMTGGTLVGDGAVWVSRVHSDTRSLQVGDLFVALKGERFDANTFLAQAKAAGAVAALCQGDAAPLLQAAGLSGVVVPDSKAALGALAAAWRARFKLPLIAVTGSNGKTTVTQMVAGILRAQAPQATLATQGNLNNDIGVPLTVCGLRASHQLAVVELGMNHPGEIAQIAAIAQPSVALVNNAQREHLEFMATIEAVAQENGAVISALPATGTAVFPADDAYTGLWKSLAAQRQTLTFGLQDSHADVQCISAVWQSGAWHLSANTPAGLLTTTLHIAGLHNVKNALAAAACALAAGVPLAAIAQGLAAFEPVKGRSRALSVQLAGRELTVVDDSYNANPDSLRAAIDVLASLPSPQLLVLGDMGEVGDQGPAFHAEVGAYAREQGITSVYTLGTLAAHAGAQHFSDMAALQAAVLTALSTHTSVLVKGSRFMKMEQVVQAIMAHEEKVHAA
jgi:UDP-N-acetylmuramoyl-tripeptide--D-alanyl-D-alanine ligase